MTTFDSAPRCLLVEDDEDDAVLLMDLFEDIWPKGPEPTWAKGPEAAIRRITEARFDLLLLDFRLGAVTGLALLDDLRDAGWSGPTILLTGMGDAETDRAATRAGAADFLPKSELSPTLLERSIRYALANHRVLEDLAEMQMRIAESREAERLALARDLHDGPMQDLIGLRFMLSTLQRSLPDEGSRARLEEAQSGIDGVTRTLRSLCGELRPPSLTPFGLASSLRSHADALAERHPDLALSLSLDDDGQRLPEPVRLALFRIYQHAISNVIRHAGAQRAWLRFKMGEDSLRLEVEDDGKGFEAPESWLAFGRDGHYGFLGAQERATSLGGKLEVRSAPGEGTCVRVVAPMPEPSAAVETGDEAAPGAEHRMDTRLSKGQPGTNGTR